MSTTETKTQTLKPEEIPFTSPQLMSRFITDTGKILPRKYTGFSAKQQRKVTAKIKRALNLLESLPNLPTSPAMPKAVVPPPGIEPGSHV